MLQHLMLQPVHLPRTKVIITTRITRHQQATVGTRTEPDMDNINDRKQQEKR